MSRLAGVFILLVGCTSGQVPAPRGIHSGPYKGWSEVLFLEAPEARVSLIAVPEAGGRIISYSLGGVNILFDNPDYLGKTLANTPPEKLAQGYIGYNIDLGPELRRIPPHLPLWMGPFTSNRKESGIELLSGVDPAVGISIEKELRLNPQTGALELFQTMKNRSPNPQAYCLWDRTLCQGGGFAVVRVSRKSRFAAGWSLLKDGLYQGENPSHPGVTVERGVLVAEAKGPSTKLGIDSEAGWIAYARGKLLFIKYFPYFPQGSYTDGGNSVEIYFDPKVCELEPLSPEVRLAPGEEYRFPERWTLLDLKDEVRTPIEARDLADRIPESPFK